MHRFAIILLLSLFFLKMVNAQSTAQLIGQAGTEIQYPGNELLIVYDSTIVDVQETGLSYVHMHKLTKVLSVSGAKELSTLIFDYDAQSAYIEIKEVNIYRKGYKKESVAREKMHDYPAPARMIYWGARQKMVEIGRLAPGDAVEVILFKKGYTYALLQQDDSDDERYIPPMKGHYYDIVEFWSKHPVKLKNYRVSIPEDKHVNYKFYNGNPEFKKSIDKQKQSYSFTLRNFNKIKTAPRSVGMSDIAPKLLISTSPDWEAKSSWFYGVNEDYGSFETFPLLTKKVEQILKGAANEMDSISRLTHWVADNMRYSGISMGDGEGFTLHNSEMNFTDRCGVCKDKAGLLISMLRAAGFESYAAMTMAGSRIDRIPADQFNHCVTVVKMNDGNMKMLDPTWVPFVRELWSSLEQQQNYLMGLPEGADLMETPIANPENHYIRLSNEVKVGIDGSIAGTIRIKAEGQSDAALRRQFTSQFKNRWNLVFEKEMLKIDDKVNYSITGIETPYDYSEPFDITITYSVPDYARIDSSSVLIYPVLPDGFMHKYMSHLGFNESLEKRDHAFRDRCSRLVEIDESFILPLSWIAKDYDESDEFIGSSVSYRGSKKQTVKSTDGADVNIISLHQEISLGKRIYEASEWNDFKKAVKFHKTYGNQWIVLNK
jgi:hypothetical protein